MPNFRITSKIVNEAYASIPYSPCRDTYWNEENRTVCPAVAVVLYKQKWLLEDLIKHLAEHADDLTCNVLAHLLGTSKDYIIWFIVAIDCSRRSIIVTRHDRKVSDEAIQDGTEVRKNLWPDLPPLRIKRY